MAGRLAPLFGGAQLARPAKGPFVFRACVLREHRGPARTMQELTEAARAGLGAAACRGSLAGTRGCRDEIWLTHGPAPSSTALDSTVHADLGA